VRSANEVIFLRTTSATGLDGWNFGLAVRPAKSTAWNGTQNRALDRSVARRVGLHPPWLPRRLPPFLWFIWGPEPAGTIRFPVNNKLAGLIGLADPIKPTTPAAIDALHKSGVRVVMLTGDNRTTAEAVAKKLGIDEFEADVLPQQKVEAVKHLQAKGRKVAIAGDGINDAPALAGADVGIAMGTSTDVAIESAGITLVKGDLRGGRNRPASRAWNDAQYPPGSLFCFYL